MTQGKLSVANKAPGTEGQQQVHEKKETPAVPSAPPSYEEATSGEGMKAGVFSPAPPAVPLHPSWAYVDPSSSSSYDSGFPTGDHELFTTFSWDDQKVRRVFIRKVYTILLIQLLVTLAVVALFTFCDPVKDYVQANPAWYWASYAVFFATYLTLACCSGPRYANGLRKNFLSLEHSFTLLLISDPVHGLPHWDVVQLLQHHLRAAVPGHHSPCLPLSHRLQLPDQVRLHLLPGRALRASHDSFLQRTHPGHPPTLPICALAPRSLCSTGSGCVYIVPGT
ncbi:protein lifeguard 2 isoform X11 [Macaca mulatta]